MPEEENPTEKEKIYVTLPVNAIIREVPAKNYGVCKWQANFYDSWKENFSN